MDVSLDLGYTSKRVEFGQPITVFVYIFSLIFFSVSILLTIMKLFQ